MSRNSSSAPKCSRRIVLLASTPPLPSFSSCYIFYKQRAKIYLLFFSLFAFSSRTLFPHRLSSSRQCTSELCALHSSSSSFGATLNVFSVLILLLLLLVSPLPDCSFIFSLLSCVHSYVKIEGRDKLFGVTSRKIIYSPLSTVVLIRRDRNQTFLLPPSLHQILAKVLLCTLFFFVLYTTILLLLLCKILYHSSY